MQQNGVFKILVMLKEENSNIGRKGIRFKKNDHVQRLQNKDGAKFKRNIWFKICQELLQCGSIGHGLSWYF
jgi:hypothetical protein